MSERKATGAPRRVAEGKIRAWPKERGRGAEAVRWQVWIGHQLRRWRLAMDEGRGQTLKWVAFRVAMPPSRLSQIEGGHRRVDAIELLALAQAYGRGPEDLRRLFTPPSAADWKAVRERRTSDPRYSDGPGSAPVLPPTPDQSAPTRRGTRRNERRGPVPRP